MTSREEMLALANKIKYAIDTESKVTLYATHGRMAEAAIRSQAGSDTNWFDECAKQAGKAMKRYQALEQIAVVCTDNMDRDCNHRMALDFVRQIANDAMSADPQGASSPPTNNAETDIWERAAKTCDRSAALHRSAMEGDTVTGRTIRLVRIEEAEWLAKTMRLTADQVRASLSREEQHG